MLYREFAAPTPVAIDGCPCCISTRGTDVLLTTPLRAITSQALGRYVSGAFLTVGNQRDFRYFLPRIFEVSALDPISALHAEIVVGKLRLAEWRSWSTRERRSVEDFLDAWFELALARDLAEADDYWVGSEAESVLCGAAHAGLSLVPWLARLQKPEAGPVLADLTNRFPKGLSAFWKGAPEGSNELSKLLTRGQA